MLNWPISKAKNNITNTLWSSPLISWVDVLLQVWKAHWSYVSKLTNSQRARTPVSLVYFLQKAKANSKSVTLRLAPLAFVIKPTKIPWTVMRYFSSNTSQLAIEVSFTVSLRLCTPFREVIDPAKLSNETSFKMDIILICTHLLVNQKAPCSRSTTFRGIQLCDTLTLVVQIKQILRRYKQPPVFFLISMAHIKA